MSLPDPKKSRWKRIDERFVYLNNILLKVGLWILIITGLVMLRSEFRQDQFLISTIEVPLSFEEQGIKPTVAAQRIFDEINTFQQKVTSVREASGFSTNQQAKSVDFQVAGFGLSLQTLASHLRSAVGKTDQTIRGEILEGVDSVSLRLRMGGETIAQLSEKLNPDREVTMNSLALMAAQKLFSKTEPYLYAVHITNTKPAAESLLLAKSLIQDPKEKKWGCNLTGTIYVREKNYLKAIKYFKKAEKEDAHFLLPKRNLAFAYKAIDSFERAIDYFDQAIALSESDQNAVWFKSEKYYLLKSHYPGDPRIKLLEKEFNQYQDDQFLSNLASNHSNNADFTSAIYWASKSYDINPENTTARTLKMILSCATEDHPTCRQLIVESKEIDPNSHDVLFAEAIVAVIDKDLEKLNNFIDTLSLNKERMENVDMKNLLALQCVLKNDNEQAQEIIDSFIGDFTAEDIEKLKALTFLKPLFQFFP